MNIVKKYLDNGQYVTDEFIKKSIFLHHTGGLDAQGAWRWWNSTPERVGAAYIIDRNGTIVECFDPKYWAYHLGVIGDDNFHEKHSVNIELVSAGHLKYIDEEFRFYPLWPNKFRYSVIPKNEVMVLKKPWRGERYFHRYTGEQMTALELLLMKIYQDFPSIGYDTDPETFIKYDVEVLNAQKAGIWSHTTVRKDKVDIYPDEHVFEVVDRVTSFQKNLNKPIVTRKAKKVKS